MSLVAVRVSADEALCRRYGLSPHEAQAVIERFGHQADDHCERVASRLRTELRLLTGITSHVGRNIPALTLAKDETVKNLMFTLRPGALTNHSTGRVA
jgi:hypothetical protein